MRIVFLPIYLPFMQKQDVPNEMLLAWQQLSGCTDCLFSAS